MADSWVKVFATSDLVQADWILSVLEQNDIAAVKMNKKDSAYVMLGIIELYVKPENVLRALNIIESTNHENPHNQN
jgi:type III secretory pathway lipoprotein EscJ